MALQVTVDRGRDMAVRSTASIRQFAWTRWRQWHGGFLADLVPSLLAVMLLAATIAYHLKSPAPASVAISNPQADRIPGSVQASFDPALLENWHPFGVGTAAGAIAAQAAAHETALSLTLKGVYFSAPGRDSGYAIIAIRGSGERAYAVGDTVPGDATLYRVEKRRVILEHGGRLETLSLPKPDAQNNDSAGTADNTEANAVEISARTR